MPVQYPFSLSSGNRPLILFSVATSTVITAFKVSLAAKYGHMSKFWPMRCKQKLSELMKRGTDCWHVLFSYSSSTRSLLLAWNADVTTGASATLLAHEATVRLEGKSGRER